MREAPFTFLRGFTMGAADIVPGVSGGTVALVFGIYHRLIDAIRTGSSAIGHLLRGDASGAWQRLRAVEWGFLLPLLAGILAAVAALSGVVGHLLEDAPVEMAGLFLGLVAGSVVVAWKLLDRRDVLRLAVLVGVGVLTFMLLGLREGTSEDSVDQIDNPALWAFFLAGAIAICAMILPGISGSFILVMLGMYGAVLAAVNERDIAAVLAVALGCVVGLALFSQVLHWALSTHYSTVMAALIGLMVGSTRVLWPWPAGVDSTALHAPADPVALPIALAVVGFVLVVMVNSIAANIEGGEQALADDIRSV